MPKVGKLTTNKITGGLTDLEIHYSKKRGQYQSESGSFSIKGLPEAFLRLTAFRNDGYKTEEELREALDVAIKEYKDLLTKTRKIIVYSIAASDNLTKVFDVSNRFSKYNKLLPGISDKIKSAGSEEHDIRLSIEWEILLEVTDVTKKYYRVGEDGEAKGYETHINKMSDFVMDWTPEAEAFFLQMETSMRKMVKSLSDFFFTGDSLIKKISSTALLLPLIAPEKIN